MRDLPKAGELAFIQGIRTMAGRPRGGVRVGIGDDCAVLKVREGRELLVTTDFSLEGRHFLREVGSGRSAGHRCLARGLSDIAAMGGKPLSAFLSLALPKGLRSTDEGRRWVDGFLAGLLALAEATGTQLSGGDTAAAPSAQIVADIVVLGTVPQGRALLRSAARVGDRLYVTGAMGGAAAELRGGTGAMQLCALAPGQETQPHFFPKPRLKVGQALLLRGLATAAIDLSDGLSTDLRHLCEESGVGAVIEAEKLPLHGMAAALGDEAMELALHGGEDYELLFTAARESRLPRRIAGVAITCIGEMVAGNGVRIRSGGRERVLMARGWEHAI